jgi:toxin-antitoxin system PIN domain toxin
MMLVDANLLLYAADNCSEPHLRAQKWWHAQLSGSEPVCLCWPVLNAFLRIGTNPRLQRQPLTLADAIPLVQSWLDQPCVKIIHPTEQHWTIFQQMLRNGSATANLVTDAHLAALAAEHNCVLQSTDRDFARFRGLKWKNPIEEK